MIAIEILHDSPKAEVFSVVTCYCNATLELDLSSKKCMCFKYGTVQTVTKPSNSINSAAVLGCHY